MELEKIRALEKFCAKTSTGDAVKEAATAAKVAAEAAKECTLIDRKLAEQFESFFPKNVPATVATTQTDTAVSSTATASAAEAT